MSTIKVSTEDWNTIKGTLVILSGFAESPLAQSACEVAIAKMEQIEAQQPNDDEPTYFPAIEP